MRQQIPPLAQRPALLVQDVTPQSLADKTGLKTGDLIIQLGDVPVGDLTTWAALSAHGAQTRLLVLRAGQTLELQINLQP